MRRSHGHREGWIAPGLVALALAALAGRALAEDPPPAPDPLPRVQPGQLVPRGFGDPTRPEQAPEPDAGAPLEPPRFPQLDEPGRVPPPDHAVDYLNRHGAIARADARPCQDCHRDQQCLDCHDGALRPTAIHPPGYVAFHAIEARRESQGCATCHTAPGFCRDCHQSLLMGGVGASSPVPGVRFHPGSWLGQGAGPDHAEEARRNLWSCTSCHTEQECVRCHANVNPHPPGWASSCAALLGTNPRSCARCHTDLTRLRQLCR